MAMEWLFNDELQGGAALVTANQEVSWTDFRAQVQSAKKQFAQFSGKRVGVQLSPTVTSFVQLFAMAASDTHLFLMGTDASPATVRCWAEDFALHCVLDANGVANIVSEKAPVSQSPAITILTSGTTGKPKAVRHSLESLTRPVRKTKTALGTRWLLTFRPHLYAGLQVIMQCLLNGGTLVVPGESDNAEEVARLAASAGVQYASATPSYWRWMLTLAGDDLEGLPLKQITLGGEAADQAILDALQSTFPSARIVHIYATTELGRCFSVTDGEAGFPSKFLDEVSADGVELRIDDGELVVRSANGMAGYDNLSQASPKSEWFSTGDLVEQIGQRVQFMGRTTDMINVGGNKVYPVEVETLIRSIPGVLDTRIFGEASSMVGELVKCEIVVETGYDAAEVEAAVRKTTLSQLTNYQRPRFISIVREIPRTLAGKVRRN